MGCEGCESEKPVTGAHQTTLPRTSSEAVLTRIDSSDKDALVGPTSGRHVIQKVREEWSKLVPSDAEPEASSAHHRVVMPRRGICHHEIPSEVDVAAPAARVSRVHC